MVISAGSLETEAIREAQEVLETVRFTNFNLTAGQTLSGVFKPALSFTVGQGWALNYPPAPDWFIIERNDAFLSFLNVAEVYDPEHPSEDNVSATPEDLVGWLKNHPHLKVTDEKKLFVGGVPGVQLDVSCRGSCVSLFPTSTEDFSFLEGYRNQLTILQVGGETVVISAESPADNFNSFQPEAQDVISSVKWNG